MANEANITLDSRDEALLLLGSRDQFLRLIRETLGVRLVARGDIIHVQGSEQQVEQAQRVFSQLRQMLRQQGKLSTEDVRVVLDVVRHGGDSLQPPSDSTGNVGRYL